MEREFKVGDKVKILVEMDKGGTRRSPVGSIGIVDRIDYDPHWSMPISVRDTENLVFWYAEDELELVEDIENDTDKKMYNESISDGERAAWEIINILVNELTEEELHDIFGCGGGLPYILKVFPYEVIKERVERHMEKNRFKVGDEVVFANDSGEPVGVVTMIHRDESLCGVLWADGRCGNYYCKEVIKKTGRTFPQLVEILDKMKERSD